MKLFQSFQRSPTDGMENLRNEIKITTIDRGNSLISFSFKGQSYSLTDNNLVDCTPEMIRSYCLKKLLSGKVTLL